LLHELTLNAAIKNDGIITKLFINVCLLNIFFMI